MNQVEDRLRAAAEETRRLARSRAPRGAVEQRQERTRGWLVLATAFATVALTFGLVPWLASNNQDTTGGDGASLPAATPSTIATTTATDVVETCSAGEVPRPDEIAGLPVTVADTRNAIITAAAECDLASLETLAGDRFATSLAGGGAENLRLWEDHGQGQLGTLLQLLDMAHDTIALEHGGEIYVWPAAHTRESWDAVTSADLDDLRKIYGPEELDQFASADSYLGWRTGIDDEGNWLYFIAGD